MKIDEKIKIFKNEIKIWSKTLQVFPYDVKLERMKQWGYCSADKVIYFNSDLLFKRKELQIYVIVHELLHLKIPNHGKLFQSLMNLHIPNWKDLDKELNSMKEELSPVDSYNNSLR
ncbi:MAG: M48 family metallopeptidase [Bdellovibrionales bacterium]|nr:M48 family metallopeptidase [Bdellovibrionales bacterium]